jgi:hypothetical protein
VLIILCVIYAKCHIQALYVECHYDIATMLSVNMLSVIMLNVMATGSVQFTSDQDKKIDSHKLTKVHNYLRLLNVL